MKMSLHASGLRQVGLTSDFVQKNPLPEGKSRHFDSWTEPARMNDLIDIEYVLRFPTDHLRDMPEPPNGKRVYWLPAAPEGMSLDIALCVSKPMDHLNLDFKGTVPVAFAKLVDGRFLVLAARHGDVGRHDNEAVLVEELRRQREVNGFGAEPSHRLLVGFNAGGLRGWADYSVDQFLADAARPAAE